MPFTDDQYEEALREVYASAPTAEIALHTLELRHSAFRDENDAPTHLRIVADGADFSAKLEATAPVQAGQTVLFQQVPFNITRPEQSDQALPEAQISIDNVSRELIPQLDRALETMEAIQITYREYLVSRAAIGPSYRITGLQGKKVSAGVFRVSGSIGFFDLVNARWPLNDYTTETHRGLAR